MFNIALLFLLSTSSYSIADDDIGLIITDYTYDQWGRAIPHSRVVNNSGYTNPYNDPNFNPYTPKALPGADPNRFDDLFYQNQKR